MFTKFDQATINFGSIYNKNTTQDANSCSIKIVFNVIAIDMGQSSGTEMWVNAIVNYNTSVWSSSYNFTFDSISLNVYLILYFIICC